MGRLIIKATIALALKLAALGSVYSVIFYLEEPTLPEKLKRN